MPKLEIEQIPSLSDNYAVLIHDPETGMTAAVDTPDPEAILKRLAAKGWRLTHILNTHHHGDHTGGNLRLKDVTDCEVIGPAGEADRIPGIDREVAGGDTVHFGPFDIKVLDTPGHTAGHITYWIPKAHVAFVGDTLFAMGCGRVFEGNAEMMWNSLKTITELPHDTEIYCGHEYTAANARFALTLDPDNRALRLRADEVEALRADGKPTLPTRLDLELETNPFLRADAPSIREKLGMRSEPAWRVFAEIRERRNKA